MIVAFLDRLLAADAGVVHQIGAASLPARFFAEIKTFGPINNINDFNVLRLPKDVPETPRNATAAACGVARSAACAVRRAEIAGVANSRLSRRRIARLPGNRIGQETVSNAS